MSSQQSNVMTTPGRKKTPHSILKGWDSSKLSDENMKPGGTPLNHFKTTLKSTPASSPKTPFSSHNRPLKSPQTKSSVRCTTPKNVSSSQVRPSILKSKGPATAPTTPRQNTTANSKPITPKAPRTFKSPCRAVTPVKVENSVIVKFSKDVFSNISECSTPTRPAQSLSDISPDPLNMFDRLNRSHSASSLFRLKKKDEETPKAALKRSLSEAKISLDSSMEPEGEKSRLTVGVRVRPLLPREGMNGIQVTDGEIKVASDLGSELSFAYDHCFSFTSTQQEVYEALVQPLLDNAFDGYNACLFAYGQTGSGKTYSMMGPYSEDKGEEPCLKDDSGMIPRFCAELLERKAVLEEANPSITLTAKVSYLEVYNEKIHDLLVPGNTQLRVREHPVYGPYVVDLSQHSVNSFQEIQHWMAVGNKKRAVAATEQNDKSSRSHSLFTVKLTQSFTQIRSDGSWSHDQTRRSQINLVDLAGSERIANSAVSSDRLREGVSINRSLLTLGKVMSALVDRRGFVPYRESVLTWLLKESLGGNSRTCMLATISPCSNHMDESLSTLRYASQARAIVNRVRVNEAPQDREIRLLREEVEQLRGAGERIHALLGENKDLQKELKHQKDTNRELQDELSKCRIDVKNNEEMRSQLLKEISDISVANESVMVQNEEISKYENEIRNYEEKLVKLHDEYSLVKKQLELQEQKYKEKEVHEQEKHFTYQDKLSQLKAEIRKLKQNLENADTNNEILKDTLEAKDIEISKINKKIKENENRINDLEKDFLALQEDFKNSEITLTETKKKNESLNKTIKDLCIKEESLKQELEQIPALERALNDFESELRKCKDDLIESRRCKEELERKNIELEEQLQENMKTLSETNEREELLKIKVEKIPALESELRLAEAEARKAKRELEEYLSQSTDSDDSIGNELNDTLFQPHEDALNDTGFVTSDKRVTNMPFESQTESKNEELHSLQNELETCKNQLNEAEVVSSKLVCELVELRLEKTNFEEKYIKYRNELHYYKEKVSELQDKLEGFTDVEQNLKSAKDEISGLEKELLRMKEHLRDEKKNGATLEEKLVDCNVTIKQLKLKADNAIHFEIELGKSREELQKIKSSHMKEVSEFKSREEAIKAELALKNQQMDHLQNQLEISQEMQKNIVQENLGLIKVMKKKCHESETSKTPVPSHLLEQNIELKKDLATLKEKLSEKDKQLADSQSLLIKVIQHEAKHEKALLNAKLECASEVFDYTMENAYPHHLNYIIRKARKFTETYKIPYEFELQDKTVLIRHLLLSAKAKLGHFQLSNWVEKIEAKKYWNQCMDRDIPWEVDFRDYYDKNFILKPSEEDSTEADSAINYGVQQTSAGCVNPILWRKTMVKRHVLGIREDSEVLIRYFNETEDSRIYSILSRIQVAVARLQEATENVEK